MKMFSLRRAMLNVPLNDLRKIDKSMLLQSLDAIVFDLEDGVPVASKSLARFHLREALIKVFGGFSSKLKRPPNGQKLNGLYASMR